MIHLNFSQWWLLLPLALILLLIVGSCSKGSGIGGGLLFCFVALICLAIFLIVLACMVGYYFGHA